MTAHGRRSERALERTRRHAPGHSQGAGALVVAFSSVGRRPRASRSRRAARRSTARFLDRGGRERARHGVHRANASWARASPRRRRSSSPRSCRVPLDPRDAGPVRYRAHARSGHDVGSQSHPANFNRSNLALAAATARERCSRWRRRGWACRAEQLAASDGVVSVTVGAVEGVELRGADGRAEVRSDARTRPRGASRSSEWTILGTPVPRLELPALVTAASSSCTTCASPACCTAASSGRRPSARRSRSVDEGSVRGMPGIVKVVVKKNFVGVVAESRGRPAGRRDAEGHLDAGPGRCRRRASSTRTCAASRRATRSSWTRRTSTSKLARRRTV